MFEKLGLSKDLLQAVSLAGYAKPTEIQIQSIPLVLAGKDLLAEAKTGTGKTACFALPILQLMQNFPSQERRTIKALILTPTRELAMQVNTAIKVYGRNLSKPMRSVLLVGGLNIDVQMREVAHGADIAVATPGRLLDIVIRQKVNFNDLKFLVIDEADKMFDLGFAKELGSVLNLLPAKRQNLLFSATINDDIKILTDKFMPNATHIKIASDIATAEHIHQRAIQVNRTNRGPLLRYLIKTEHWRHALIFVASARSADILTVKLLDADIKATAFHGGLTQAQRTQVLTEFKNNAIDVLVATDLAARGIDINKLPVVVNYDLPRSPDDYIHRIGRTGRAEQAGVAITFIGHEDQAHFALIEKRVRMRLLKEVVKGFELTGSPLPIQQGNAPVKGLRMSKKDKALLKSSKENDG